MWRLVYKQETNAAIRMSKSLPQRISGSGKSRPGPDPRRRRCREAISVAVQRDEAAARHALCARALLPQGRQADRKPRRSCSISRPITRSSAMAKPGGSSAASSRACCSIRASPDTARPPISSPARMASPRASFWSKASFSPAGSRCASSRTRTTALKHFTKLQAGAVTRTDGARAAYWIGRSYAALGDKANAKAAYRDAAQVPTVFYGQLAREELGLAGQPISITGGQPSAAAQARVDDDEVMRAFQMVAADRAQPRAQHVPVVAIGPLQVERRDECRRPQYVGGRRCRPPRSGLPSSPARRASISTIGAIRRRHCPIWRQIGPPVETRPRLWPVAPGKRIRSKGRQPRRRARPDAADAGNGEAGAPSNMASPTRRRSSPAIRPIM